MRRHRDRRRKPIRRARLRKMHPPMATANHPPTAVPNRLPRMAIRGNRHRKPVRHRLSRPPRAICLRRWPINFGKRFNPPPRLVNNVWPRREAPKAITLNHPTPRRIKPVPRGCRALETPSATGESRPMVSSGSAKIGAAYANGPPMTPLKSAGKTFRRVTVPPWKRISKRSPNDPNHHDVVKIHRSHSRMMRARRPSRLTHSCPRNRRETNFNPNKLCLI